MQKKLLLCIVVICTVFFFPAVEGSTYSFVPTFGTNYTAPPGNDPSAYGAWTDIIIQNGVCNPATCWGTGFENAGVNLTGNEFYQEYHFTIYTIEGSDISNLTLCFSSCWTGGVNGCTSSDAPEFNGTNNGTAQLQIYNGVTWEDVDSSINLGNYENSSVMGLSTYCKSKNSSFNDNYIINYTAKFRVQVFGDYIDSFSDCEMFTDYVGLDIRTIEPAPSSGGSGGGGGGGGSSCQPFWQCAEWSDKCDIIGNKHRTCVDLNDCNIINGIPALTRECTARELCFNGLRDFGEQGIDCGGECEPCPPEMIELDIQVPAPAEAPEEPSLITLCGIFKWPFWIIYLLVLVLSYYTIIRFKEVHWRQRKEKLIKSMIATNVLLFILVLTHFFCILAWYMIIPLLIVFFTIVKLDKTWLKYKEKKKRK